MANGKTEVALTFGRRKPDGREVTFSEWEAFVRGTIVPLFPAGFSVVDLQGYWHDSASGRTIEERSKRFSVVVDIPHDNVDLSMWQHIASVYKRLFHQEAVMLTVSPIQVDFI